jgi:Ni,Fe-hydrogenase III small subunit
LVVPDIEDVLEEVETARTELATRVRALRRSIHVRHVDAGSDGADEWEVAALTNPIYDVQRLGIFFTASPKHADLLLVTGVGSAGMLGPLRHTFEVMPNPKVVIAVGTEAISGGLLGEGYATHGGVTELVPVDVFVPGSPPTPFGILYGILLAVGLLTAAPPPSAKTSGADVTHPTEPEP